MRGIGLAIPGDHSEMRLGSEITQNVHFERQISLIAENPRGVLFRLISTQENYDKQITSRMAICTNCPIYTFIVIDSAC